MTLSDMKSNLMVVKTSSFCIYNTWRKIELWNNWAKYVIKKVFTGNVPSTLLRDYCFIWVWYIGVESVFMLHSNFFWIILKSFIRVHVKCEIVSKKYCKITRADVNSSMTLKTFYPNVYGLASRKTKLMAMFMLKIEPVNQASARWWCSNTLEKSHFFHKLRYCFKCINRESLFTDTFLRTYQKHHIIYFLEHFFFWWSMKWECRIYNRVVSLTMFRPESIISRTSLKNCIIGNTLMTEL